MPAKKKKLIMSAKQDLSNTTGDFTCPICEEIVQDLPADKESEAGHDHDAVFCEGKCNTWLHRRCAGLSRSLFVAGHLLLC